MGPCPACGAETPAGARFCPACGTRQIDGPSAGQISERRIVTTLFCDLVGFTALGERTDPEDVDALLRSYHGLARKVVEQYGGSVEKFIGDAVVGVFGVPTAHEDDAERAVRAALRLQERLGEGLPGRDDGRLQARIGVDTGNVLVRLDVDPLTGETVHVGDSVNTASRLQALAPPGGVVVGEMTRSLAAHVAPYERLPDVKVKGKAVAVRSWLVTGRAAHLGIDLRRRVATPFVGRGLESGILAAIFEQAADSASPQGVLVVAEAGIGKSRLLLEMARSLDDRPELLVQWRQVRCTPYAEEGSLQPLAQLLREHAAIAPSDDDDTVDRKLGRSLGELSDGAWLLGRLRALLGRDGPAASRQENFAAWQRALEMMAAARPTVLVFEDVHWAGATLLDFLLRLVSEAGDVPLLVVLTARPELLQEHPELKAVPAAGHPSARLVRLDLHPLSSRDTARLLAPLLEEADPRLAEQVADRCGGNPLYAEELALFVADRAQAPDACPAGDALPESLQTLIAARLETLDGDQRAVLAAAAVAGQTFWRGAVTAMSARDPRQIEAAVAGLVQRQLLRPVTDHAAGAPDLAFWHAVVRDVAYAALTRSRRAAAHTALADWLDGDAGAEARSPALVAHHLTAALEATGTRGDGADDLVQRAVAAHCEAAREAGAVDVLSAEHHLSRAAALAHEGHRDRPGVWIEWGVALGTVGRLDEARAVLERGIAGAAASGDDTTSAYGLGRLSTLLNWMGDPAALETSARALGTLESRGPSEALVSALEERAMTCVMLFRSREGIGAADRALAVAASLGSPAPARALLWRGAGRCDLGDSAGLRDMQQALALAHGGRAQDLSSLHYNYAEALLLFEGVPRAADVCRQGIEVALRRGDVNGASALETGLCWTRLWGGEWDAVAHDLTKLRRRLAESGDQPMAAELHTLAALLALLRGDTAAARRRAVRAQRIVDDTFDSGNHAWSCSSFLAAVHHGCGQDEAARAQLEHLERVTRDMRAAVANGLPYALRTMADLGALELGERLVSGLPGRPFDRGSSRVLAAHVAEHEGLAAEAAAAFGEAAGIWQGLHIVPEEAFALLGRGRCLVRIGEYGPATTALGRAQATFSRLRARHALAETEELLSQAGVAFT